MRQLTLFTICFFLVSSTLAAENIQDAGLAGSWYPLNSTVLSNKINTYLDAAEVFSFSGDVLALICPHAGINYSGEVAASAFKAVSQREIDTVIVVGFSHKLNYEGVAVFDQDGFKTPLGVLYTDKNLVNEITEQDNIFVDSTAFIRENSVELILPFIQSSFKNPKVLLLAIGQQNFKNSQVLGEALYEILKEKDNFLIIASTDLSHYLSQSEAEAIDTETAELIAKMQPQELFLASVGKSRMCGGAAVVATMIAAKKLGADRAVVLNKSTSAKTSGDSKRVVGYLSVAFLKSDHYKTEEGNKMESLLNDQQKKELLSLARNTIVSQIKTGRALKVEVDDPALKEVMGVFVTIHKAGQLRGCIGNIIGTEPLYIGVRDMAIAASTQDPRFPALEEAELADIDIEISVLSPLKKITNPDKIVLGVHGVLVKQGFRSGVYLPQVATETGWDKSEFMDSLCAHKAGISADAWRKGECEIYIFSAEVIGE